MCLAVPTPSLRLNDDSDSEPRTDPLVSALFEQRGNQSGLSGD